MVPIILASSSPRRQELLARLKIPFNVYSTSVNEGMEREMPPGSLVENLALRKARACADQISEGLVIGSDTVVTLKGRVLGKPGNEDEALEMLWKLQGREHEVYTGLALIDASSGTKSVDHECTVVRFRPAGRDELQAYVDTGEPLDKAGSYGIQGLGSVFVTGINGCYFNVVGLPIVKLTEMLREFGVNVTSFWRE